MEQVGTTERAAGSVVDAFEPEEVDPDQVDPDAAGPPPAGLPTRDDSRRPPIVVILATVLFVAQVVVAVGVSTVILAALASLGLAISVGPSGGQPTALDPTGTALVVVAVLGALGAVLAVVVFAWWVRGLWRGGWRRTFTAMLVLVLGAAGAAWAAHDEPLGLLRYAQVGVPAFTLLLLLTPAARRWRTRDVG